MLRVQMVFVLFLLLFSGYYYFFFFFFLFFFFCTLVEGAELFSISFIKREAFLYGSC